MYWSNEAFQSLIIFELLRYCCIPRKYYTTHTSTTYPTKCMFLFLVEQKKSGSIYSFTGAWPWGCVQRLEKRNRRNGDVTDNGSLILRLGINQITSGDREGASVLWALSDSNRLINDSSFLCTFQNVFTRRSDFFQQSNVMLVNSWHELHQKKRKKHKKHKKKKLNYNSTIQRSVTMQNPIQKMALSKISLQRWYVSSPRTLIAIERSTVRTYKMRNFLLKLESSRRFTRQFPRFVTSVGSRDKHRLHVLFKYLFSTTFNLMMTRHFLVKVHVIKELPCWK